MMAWWVFRRSEEARELQAILDMVEALRASRMLARTLVLQAKAKYGPDWPTMERDVCALIEAKPDAADPVEHFWISCEMVAAVRK